MRVLEYCSVMVTNLQVYIREEMAFWTFYFHLNINKVICWILEFASGYFILFCKWKLGNEEKLNSVRTFDLAMLNENIYVSVS